MINLVLKSGLSFLLRSTRQPGSSSRSSSHPLRWLMNLGGVGLFCVAVIDSSMIPIPLPGSTDLLLLLLTAYRASSLPLVASYVAWALAGSAVGGYMWWGTGLK